MVETLSTNILPTNEAIIDHCYLQCKQQPQNYNPQTDITQPRMFWPRYTVHYLVENIDDLCGDSLLYNVLGGFQWHLIALTTCNGAVQSIVMLWVDAT